MIIAFITFLIVLIVVVSLFIGVFGIPYVPSPTKVFKNILEANIINDGDIIYELGSGTGGFLTYIGKRKNIIGVGYEIAPLFYIISIIRSIFIRNSKIIFKFSSYSNARLDDADIVYVYLLPKGLGSLQHVFDTLKRGGKIISLDFQIPGKLPNQILAVGQKKIYVYTN